VVERLLQLGASKNYQHRITLVRFCSILAHEVRAWSWCKWTDIGSDVVRACPSQMEAAIYSSLFLPALLKAAGDPCRNVRLGVARLFSHHPEFAGPGMCSVLVQLAACRLRVAHTLLDSLVVSKRRCDFCCGDLSK